MSNLPVLKYPAAVLHTFSIGILSTSFKGRPLSTPPYKSL